MQQRHGSMRSPRPNPSSEFPTHSTAWGTFGPAFVNIEGSPSGLVCDDDTLVRVLATTPSSSAGPRRRSPRRRPKADRDRHQERAEHVLALNHRQIPSLAPSKWAIMTLGIPASEWTGSKKLTRTPPRIEAPSAQPSPRPPLAAYRNFAGSYRARGSLRSPTSTYIPSPSLMGLGRSARRSWLAEESATEFELSRGSWCRV